MDTTEYHLADDILLYKAPFTHTEPVYVIRIGIRIGSVYTWAVKPDQVNTCKRVSGLQTELCNHLRCSSIGVCREEAKEL